MVKCQQNVGLAQRACAVPHEPAVNALLRQYRTTPISKELKGGGIRTRAHRADACLSKTLLATEITIVAACDAWLAAGL